MRLKNTPDPIEEHLLGLFNHPGLAMRRRAILPTEQMMREATCTGKPVLERRRINFRIIFNKKFLFVGLIIKNTVLYVKHILPQNVVLNTDDRTGGKLQHYNSCKIC